jgi:hypothetical protein
MPKGNIDDIIDNDLSPKELKEIKEDFFKQLGFKNEKEFNTYNSKARQIWKGKQKKIIYEDELSDKELELIKKDITVTKLAKQLADTQTSIVYRINQVIREHRNYEED